MAALLSAAFRYRGFILGSVKREFQTRYRSSMLGALWLILQPLAMIIVYTVIFSEVMRARMPGESNSFAYSIYLCAGTLTWGLFSEIVNRSLTVFIDNANLLKKISFPKVALPSIVVLSALINFAIVFGLFLVFLITSGNFPGLSFIGFLPVLLVQVAFSVGLGLTLGVLNVFFRDVGQLMTIAISFWFWMTPIVYPVSALPHPLHWLLKVNPMAMLVVNYQAIFVLHQWPAWTDIAVVLVEAALLIALALRLYRKHAADMIDEL
ncbi:ABC transporter permease [Robbsia sp. KACC 23696]|uniref:ABC transporter permease n=1 Tax=Robbsia sp. KACC 23696 TaxID=3149231 RepID=UPI00325A8388